MTREREAAEGRSCQGLAKVVWESRVACAFGGPREEARGRGVDA